MDVSRFSNTAPLAAKIADILRTTKNETFELYRNEALIGQLAILMAREIVNLGADSLNEVLFREAWGSLDIMLFGELMGAVVGVGHSRVLWLAEVLKGNHALLYEHQMDRFRRLSSDVPAREYAEVFQLANVFKRGECERMIYWNAAPEGRCLQMLQDANWRLSEFIEAQPDLPGVNSLVREGLVKSLRLPDGQQVIAKRNNPSKQGRFLSEQNNVAEIVARIGLPEQSSFVTLDGGGLRLKVIRPLAVACDRAHDVFYSLALYENHPTLETILLREKSPDKRSRYLAYARRVLDHLYSNGIVWGDMAPRNILVEENGEGVTFYLLDFEKTYFTDGPVAPSLRVEHARGPMCVEEFGAVCFLVEVVKCFEGYFNPEAWPLSDASTIPFAKPKREVMDILAAVGIAAPTLGQYNATERRMLNIRFPFTGADGEIRRPLHVSFKVDHYLGAEYDRRTTQLLMNALECGVQSDVVDVLNRALEYVENRLVVSQFAKRLVVDVMPAEFDNLSATIDALYACETDAALFGATLHRLSVKDHFAATHARFLLSPVSGRMEARFNWARIEPHLLSFMATLKAHQDSELIVVLYGGAARGEFSAKSDLDIAVIGEDHEQARRLEVLIMGWVQQSLGIAVEFFPPLTLRSLRAFIHDNPDCYLDFLHGRIVLGPVSHVSEYDQIVRSAIADGAYRVAVLAHYREACVNNAGSIKTMLKVAHVAKAFGMDVPSELSDRLLAAKCAESLEDECLCTIHLNSSMEAMNRVSQGILDLPTGHQ